MKPLIQALARNNMWSNHRLLQACGGLTQAEFEAVRVGFFPSLQRTLNHILVVDRYYLDGLTGAGRGLAIFDNALPCALFADLAAAQKAADAHLLRFCNGLDDPTLESIVTFDRGERGIQRDPVHAVLTHLFVHQIHHRGQAHAMLSGTRVKPPQLDEFFLSGDAPLRAREMQELGLPG